MPEEINNTLPNGERVVLTRPEIEGCGSAEEFRARLVDKVEKARAKYAAEKWEPLHEKTISRCKAAGLSDAAAAEVWREAQAGVESDKVRASELEAKRRTDSHFARGIWGG